MEIKKVIENINFVERYQSICERYSDFDNSMNNSTQKIQKEILNKFEYEYKYISNGSFYQIKEEKNDIIFQLHLVLKKGMIESLIYIYVNGNSIEPNGRLDFLAEKVGIPFRRDKYNLFFYSNKEDLKNILTGLFSIYEDFKIEFLKQCS